MELRGQWEVETMGTIVYDPRMINMASSTGSVLLANAVKDSQYTKSLIETMVENGKVVGDATVKKFDLGEVIADGIVKGVQKAFEWFGDLCIAGVKILWEFIVDTSFYACLFTATGAILMTYCGSKKCKKAIVVSIVLYVLIQMVNGILIEQGFIVP